MGKPLKKPLTDEVEFFYDVEQRSDEWFDLRRGVPTASRFAAVMAEGKDGGDSVGRAKLMRMLAGEELSGKTATTFRSEAMQRGVEMEPAALAYYARTRFADLKAVGFVKRTVRTPLGTEYIVGASPDAEVSKRKGLEIKTMEPDALIEVELKGASGFPSKHRAQCQGTMWVCDWDEMDLMLFYDGMPFAPTFTIKRDQAYIDTEIIPAVETFSYELRQLVKQLKERRR